MSGKNTALKREVNDVSSMPFSVDGMLFTSRQSFVQRVEIINADNIPKTHKPYLWQEHHISAIKAVVLMIEEN